MVYCISGREAAFLICAHVVATGELLIARYANSLLSAPEAL